MVIDSSILAAAFMKQAEEKKDPRADAMADAASAAKPSWAPSMPDFRKSEEEEDDNGEDKQKEIDQKQKEIDRLKDEKKIIEQNLQFEQIKSRQAEAQRAIEDKQRASLEKIHAEQQKLDNSKVMHQADEVRHKAMLQQQENDSQLKLQLQQSDQQLKLQQEKNKQLLDLHNQQLKIQQAAADKARAESDKYKEDSRKQIDKERQDMHDQFRKEHSGLSPALENVMGGAIKSLSQFGKMQKVKLPKPGGSPIKSTVRPITGDQVSTDQVQGGNNAQEGQDDDYMASKIACIARIPSPSGSVFIRKQAANQPVQPQYNPQQQQPVQQPQQQQPVQAQPVVPQQTQQPQRQPQQQQQASATQTRRPAGRPTPRTPNNDNYQNVGFGYPAIASMLLKAFLGDEFDFYKNFSKYNLTRSNVPVVKNMDLADEYVQHLKDSRVPGRWRSPGEISLDNAMGRDNNYFNV